MEEEGGSSGGGKRWGREETLALLKIRSETDAAFRDATVKGPLWEHVSRKLAELGYNRSAKKCKEKFENVHKYNKRINEGRGGRQDGKTYKFFSQLEALNPYPTTITTTSTTTTSSLDVAPVSVSIPPSTLMHFSSFRPSQPIPSAALRMPSSSSFPIPSYALSFSADSSSAFYSSDTDEQQPAGEPSPAAGTSSHKRKRHSSKSGDNSSNGVMMDLFEKLMKRVMQKQEVMQQRFLDTIDKIEQERLVREEAGKRQEMARLAREHELMAQERAASASRDAAVISLIQKITGHTIQFPTPLTTPPPPAPQPPAPTPTQTPSILPVTLLPQHQQPQQQPRPQNSEALRHQLPNVSSQEKAIMAIPEQQLPPQRHHQEAGTSVSSEPASSRWPKAEVIVLINLRSELESKYREAGPKGPLWEEISAGMKRMGYNRSAKRCKEKWENINKYYKKVKESNKQRPQDAKTCPYFHQLDALYRNKVFSGSSSFTVTSISQEQSPLQNPKESAKADPAPAEKVPDGTDILVAEGQELASEFENKKGDEAKESLSSNLFNKGNGGAGQKPEDIVKGLVQPQGAVQPEHYTQRQQQPTVENYGKINDPSSYNFVHGEEEDDEYEDEDEDLEEEEEEKMGFKMEFHQPNRNSSKGGGNDGTPSFLTMVQ